MNNPELETLVRLKYNVITRDQFWQIPSWVEIYSSFPIEIYNNTHVRYCKARPGNDAVDIWYDIWIKILLEELCAYEEKQNGQ